MRTLVAPTSVSLNGRGSPRLRDPIWRSVRQPTSATISAARGTDTAPGGAAGGAWGHAPQGARGDHADVPAIGSSVGQRARSQCRCQPIAAIKSVVNAASSVSVTTMP